MAAYLDRENADDLFSWAAGINPDATPDDPLEMIRAMGGDIYLPGG